MKFKLAVLVAIVALAMTPATAFANSPGPLLAKAAAEDPVLAARLTELESNAQALGVDSVADAQLKVLPDKTGVPRLMVTPQATTTGELRTLAILVDFSDHPNQVLSTFFDDMLFADLFGPASLRGYYREVSYGTASTRGLIDIVKVDGCAPSDLGWTRLPQSLAYYAGTEYGRGTYPNNSQKMVEDAIALVDSRVDFSQYDNDGDTYVDNVMVIHAGEGAEYNGPIANHIWSHAWATRTPILCDGVKVWKYSTEPEYWATPGDMRPGVYAHELGHTLGLPDLYDRDGTSSGIGEWSLMASGSWNGIQMYGDSPARMDAWSSARLGWLQPQTATGDAVSRSLPVVGSSRAASAWKVYPNGASSGSEYWMFENRQKTGTDSDIPGSGILVWHVDETMLGTQNDNEAHKLVDLEEAAGTQSMDSKTDRGTAADPYPGTTNNRAFRASSVPNSNRYSGAASLVVMDSVSDNSASMTARIGTLANTMSLNTGAVYTNSTSVTAASSVTGASTMRIDAGSGFGSWVGYASSYGIVLPAGDGSKTVTIEYRDAASATIASLSDNIILDTTGPPVLALASSSHVVEATWYSNNTATMNWSSSDAGSGVSGYSYVLDTNASTTPDAVQDSTWNSLTYSSLSDGTRYFHVRVCDNAGNWGPVSHRMIRVDTTPPATTTSIEPEKYEHSATVTLLATDASSLVASTTYALDGGPELAYTGAFDVTDMGIHTLSYHSRDNAGNDETAKQVIFSIVEDDSVTILSVDGPDRFATAVASSQLGFASADTVLIATGRNWPDALGASSLAGALKSPILLVEKSLIPAAVATEIQRLGATKAIIIGGTGAVDDDVKNRLLSTGAIKSVRRIAGADRYDTARKVAGETIAAVGPTYDGTLFVATGQNFADALAASPAAAANGWPTLLVPSNSDVPAATLDFAVLHGQRVVVLGGTGAVSYGAWTNLWGVFGTSGVTRIGGTDRFDTAVKVADWSVANAGLSYASPAIATGRSPYDALAGGVVQGTGGSVLLLTESTTLPAPTASALARNRAMISQVRYLGGLGAVSQAVRGDVGALLAP